METLNLRTRGALKYAAKASARKSVKPIAPPKLSPGESLNGTRPIKTPPPPT